MNLVKKIYERRTDDNKTNVVVDENVIESSKLIINNMHLFDIELYYPEVIMMFGKLFGKLEIDGTVYLNNMKSSKSRFHDLRFGGISFNYHQLNQDNINNNNSSISYYSMGELDGCHFPTIKVSNRTETLYYSVYNKDSINKDIFINRYDIKINNDVCLSRYFYEKRVLFVLNGLDRRIVIDIDGIEKLDNESKLVEYLSSLSEPYDIFEIYRKMTEISLGNEVDKYPRILISEEKKVREGFNYNNLLVLENGKISNLIRTTGGKIISCNSDYEWDYVAEDDDLRFYITSEGNVSCELKARSVSSLFKYINYLARYNVNSVNFEIEDTKRLIREKIGVKR